MDKSKFNAFCVGEKTTSLLVENGLKIAEMAEYASALAKNIVERYQNETFVFLCGNKRRDELPDM
ncbi:uroporphyrinogen-III synthase, partial [Pseudoalteromonas sp. SYSU M81241]